MRNLLGRATRASRGKLTWVGVGAAVTCVLLAAPIARSDGPTPETVIQVEEDWVLVLNEPDEAIDAPQFHTMMSPFGDAESLICTARITVVAGSPNAWPSTRSCKAPQRT